MASSIRTYGFINAKVKTMRSFLLTTAIYRTMVAAKDVNEILSILSQTHLRDVVGRLKSQGAEELEQELLRDQINRLREIEKFSQGLPKQVVFHLLERYDGEKLKVLLRVWHRKEKPEPQVVHEKIVYDLPVGDIASAESLGEIVTLLEGTPFGEVLGKVASVYRERKTLFPLELALDRDLFGRLWETTKSLSQRDQRIARRLLGIEVDLRNLDWAGRFREYYGLPVSEVSELLLPHGYRIGADDIRDVAAGGHVAEVLTKIVGKGRITLQGGEGEEGWKAIEWVLYHILLSEAKRAFGEYPFAIGAILGYFYLMWIEARNVRTLFHAKMYGLSPEQVETLLVL